MLHAWFSKQQQRVLSRPMRVAPSRASGGCYYATPDGGEVLVTCVSEKPEHGCAFDDMEYRGMVTKYIRQEPPLP